MDHVHPTTISYRYIAEAIRQKLVEFGVKSDPIAIIDTDDDFLLNPHAPSLAVLDTLYQPQGQLAAVESIELLAAKREVCRFMFQAPWINR